MIAYTRLTWLLTPILVTCLVALGCGDDTPEQIVIQGNPRPPMGCLSPIIPADEPNFITAPTFAADFVLPGRPVVVALQVNGNTRNISASLRNIFRLEEPPVDIVELATNGSTAPLEIEFETVDTTEGRFFIDISLCPDDCAVRSYRYTLDPEDIRAPYLRIELEGNAEFTRSSTCLAAPTVVVD